MPKIQDIEIIQAAERHASMMQAAKSIPIAYRTFIERAKRLGVYNPNQGRKGTKNPKKGPTPFSLETVLVKNSSYPRHRVKERLIEEGLLDHTECALCSQGTAWNGQELVLQLDHINGINNDNRIENLRLICPNCHSQTPTFSRRKYALVVE